VGEKSANILHGGLFTPLQKKLVAILLFVSVNSEWPPKTIMKSARSIGILYRFLDSISQPWKTSRPSQNT